MAVGAKKMHNMKEAAKGVYQVSQVQRVWVHLIHNVNYQKITVKR